MKIEITKHVHKNQGLVNSYLNVIISYVNCIHQAENKYHQSLKGGLDMALRILTGSHSSYVSEKVIDNLKINRIYLNPFDLKWEQRHQMGYVLINGRKHSMAVWEHTIPIKEFRENLIRLKCENLITQAINDYPGVAWISREEDLQLTKLGFQSKRPEGFLNCYKKAGIILLNENDFKNRF